MNITEKDKRTIRFAAIGVAVYLTLFYGRHGLGVFEEKREAYRELAKQAEDLSIELQRYETKSLRLQKLRSQFQNDPRGASKETLVAEASAAIQQAGQENGVKFGPIRETSMRRNSKALASMRIEGKGKADGMIKLLHQLKTLGFPLIVDSVQIKQDERQPGMIEAVLDVLVLDAGQWDEEGTNDA